MVIRFFLTLFAAVVLCSCSPRQASVGGYSQTRSLTQSEEQLFQSATASIEGVDYEPVNVATQVVAGTNYRFLCKAREQQGNRKKYYAVVVIYKPLAGEGEPRITSIVREER